MNRPTFWRVLPLTLLCLVLLAATSLALDIPVSCGGQRVGTISVNVATAGDRSGVSGSFTPWPPLTYAGVKAACGEDHFNWYQVVTATPHPGVDPAGNRLAPPWVDPPSGGYGNDPNTPGDDTQWADKLPWYWDEGPDPPPGTPGFADGYNLSDNSDASGLHFGDFPGSPFANQTITFKTWLVSEKADGSFHSWHEGFTWTWTAATGAGGLAPLGGPPANNEYRDIIGGFNAAAADGPILSLWALAFLAACLALLGALRGSRLVTKPAWLREESSDNA